MIKMVKDFFDSHIEIMGSDKKLNKLIKKKIKKMLPLKIIGDGLCKRCKKYPIVTANGLCEYCAEEKYCT